MGITGVIYTIYNHTPVTMRPAPSGPCGLPALCLSRLPDTDRRQARQRRSWEFIYDNDYYTLFFIFRAGSLHSIFYFRAGGGRTRRGAGRARLPEDPAGGGQSAAAAAAAGAGRCRGEPRRLLPPLLHLGAPAALGRERAGGTIRVRKRGVRRCRDSPGREWTSPCARCELAGRGGTIPATRGFYRARGGGTHLCRQHPSIERQI